MRDEVSAVAVPEVFATASGGPAALHAAGFIAGVGEGRFDALASRQVGLQDDLRAGGEQRVAHASVLRLGWEIDVERDHDIEVERGRASRNLGEQVAPF